MTRRPKSVRLGVQTLEARDVPATLIDLGTSGATGEANGALLYQGDTGTAPTYSFVRLQGSGTEQGYNTDARPLEFDADKKATTSLTLGQVPVVTVDGVNYREFLLEISQAASQTAALLSLDELRIFSGSVGNLSGYSGGTLAGQAALFDLDGAGDVTVKMDDNLPTGAGTWDVRVLVPDAAFTNLGVDDFIYLYSRFGGTFASNNGAEVWAVRPGTPTPGPTPPPPPTGGSISGYVYVARDSGGDDGVREPNAPLPDSPESDGLFGVEITLSWTVGTETFTQTATTDEFGFYTFTNLAADVSYTISRGADPAGFFDGFNQAGPVGGQEGSTLEREFDPNAPDLIFGVTLDAGENKTEYNFGMIEAPPPA